MQPDLSKFRKITILMRSLHHEANICRYSIKIMNAKQFDL